MDEKIRIVMADDHQVFMDGIKSLLKEFEQIEIVAQAQNGIQLLHMVEMYRPDIAITDIQMPEMDGMAAAAAIKEKFPETKLVVLTMLNESLYIKKMLAADVYAYILKTVDKDELVKAIESVASGKKYFNQEITELIMNSFSEKKVEGNPLEMLTKREKEIIALISKGLTDKEIAEQIHLSPLTVITHRKNILHKLGLKNKVELTRFAISNNLIS